MSAARFGSLPAVSSSFTTLRSHPSHEMRMTFCGGGWRGDRRGVLRPEGRREREHRPECQDASEETSCAAWSPFSISAGYSSSVGRGIGDLGFAASPPFIETLTMRVLLNRRTLSRSSSTPARDCSKSLTLATGFSLTAVMTS